MRCNNLTRIVRMLRQFFEPVLCDKDALFVFIFLVELEPLLVGLFNDLLHVPALQGAEDAKEEVSLRKLAAQLFRRRKIP